MSKGLTARGLHRVLVAFSLAAIGFSWWRGVVAFQHYQASILILNDPSMRELEESAALINGVVALLALAHAAAAFILSRRPLTVSPLLFVAVGLFCGTWVGAGLSGVTILSFPGVYPAGIVLASYLLSRMTGPSWLSVYPGAAVGATAGVFYAFPAADLLTCAVVVFPCAAYALIGTFACHLMMRRNAGNCAR